MTRARGTDVSFWQDSNSTPRQIDFAKMLRAGASFTFIRASQLTWIDEDFGYNWKTSKDAGLLRGAYHYLDWRGNVLDQAKLFVGALTKDPGELPPMLDFEMPPQDSNGTWLYGLSREIVITKLRSFLAYIKDNLSINPGIYTGYYFWNSYGSVDPWFKQFPFWLAWWATEDYIKAKTGGTGAPKPWDNWTFWQDTAKGDGLAYGAESLQIDMDWFNGTVEELRAWARPPQYKPCPTCVGQGYPAGKVPA